MRVRAAPSSRDARRWWWSFVAARPRTTCASAASRSRSCVPVRRCAPRAAARSSRSGSTAAGTSGRRWSCSTGWARFDLCWPVRRSISSLIELDRSCSRTSTIRKCMILGLPTVVLPGLRGPGRLLFSKLTTSRARIEALSRVLRSEGNRARLADGWWAWWLSPRSPTSRSLERPTRVGGLSGIEPRGPLETESR